MKIFIKSNSCEYDGGHFNSTTDDTYSIEVPDYITIPTLAHIIKDKENMTEHNFKAMRLITPVPRLNFPAGRHYKLNESPLFIIYPQIRVSFRVRGWS